MTQETKLMPWHPSYEQLAVVFLSGSLLETFRPVPRSEVLTTCLCDCDCSAAARYEGIALLVLGLVAGLCGPGLLRLLWRRGVRALSGVGSAPVLDTPGAERTASSPTPSSPSRRSSLSAVARPA